LTELLLYIYSNILNIQNSINKVKSGKDNSEWSIGI